MAGADDQPTPAAGATRRVPARHWVVGGACGAVALAALVAGSAFGNVSAAKIDPRLIAWVSAGALIVFGVIASTRVSWILGRLVTFETMPAAGAAVRILSAGIGYLIVLFAVLAILSVSIERLLVGAGLAGVVLGIAAQQSLGNVFAGLVLITAKPFRVGDRIRVRSGALGGIFDARVREMSLTYVTLHTDDGDLKVPNSVMLAAGIGRTPRSPLPAPAPPAAPPAPAPPAPAAPSAAPTSGAEGGSR
jgi:small-conductance mechanosensitive channel